MNKEFETNPYHEMIRQELLAWFHRNFVSKFEKMYIIRHTNVLKISKTMKSCKEYGFLVGLQGLISRILAYATIRSIYPNPIIPFSNVEYDTSYDPAIISELEHECGFIREDAIILYRMAIIDLNKASIMCLKMIKKQIFSGKTALVNYEINNSIIELSCYPSLVLKNKLMQIRNENKIKEKMNFVLYKHENDYKAKVYLNLEHYIKLSKMYKYDYKKFHTRLFCLIARYELYSGNTSGLQGAIPQYIFDKLYNLLNIDTECFASPLNCYIKNKYYSAFYDTDKYFGSKGTFFRKKYTDTNMSMNINVEENGRYEVNPPFINCIMELTVELIHEALRKYNKILFFVIVPSWTDAKFYNELLSSKYLKCFSVLESKKHEYVSGLQHRVDKNKNTWKANVDSTWFLLSKNITIEENTKKQINNAFIIRQR